MAPLLFLIYTNDLPANLSNGHALLYADDTTLFTCGSVLTEVERSHNQLLKDAEEWFSANRLSLNMEKTEKMIFSLREAPNEREYCKFLGINIDTGLTWHHHGDVLAGRLCSAVFALRRLSEIVSPGILRTSYFSLFNSHISYGLLAWGHSSIVKRIFGIQRRAIRVLARLDYREDCQEAFRNLKILTLPSLYIYECLKYVTANINLIQRHNGIHDYDTRNNTNLRQPQLRLSRSRNGSNFYGIKFYNIIGKDLTLLPRMKFLSCIKETSLKKLFLA